MTAAVYVLLEPPERRNPAGGPGFEGAAVATGDTRPSYPTPPDPAIAAATAAVEGLLSQAEPSALYCSAMREVIRKNCPCTPATEELLRRLGDARWLADRRNGRIDPETGRTILIGLRERMPKPKAFWSGPTRPGGSAA